MPIIERSRLRLDPLAFSSANKRRTPGTHLTDVVRDMLRTIGIDRAKSSSSFTREQLDDYALQGYLWEDAMTETLVSRVRQSDGMAIQADGYMRFPEIACNGCSAFWVDYDEQTGELITEIPPDYIVLSPDGGVLNTELRLLECKWTTKGAPKWHDDEQMRYELLDRWIGNHRPDWAWQTPCYLKALNLVLGRPTVELGSMDLIDLVEHHVQFACGEWTVKVMSDSDGRMISLGAGVIYEKWVRRYSAQEIDDKWGAMYGHARDTGRVR